MHRGPRRKVQTADPGADQSRTERGADHQELTGPDRGRHPRSHRAEPVGVAGDRDILQDRRPVRWAAHDGATAFKSRLLDCRAGLPSRARLSHPHPLPAGAGRAQAGAGTAGAWARPVRTGAGRSRGGRGPESRPMIRCLGPSGSVGQGRRELARGPPRRRRARRTRCTGTGPRCGRGHGGAVGAARRRSLGKGRGAGHERRCLGSMARAANQVRGSAARARSRVPRSMARATRCRSLGPPRGPRDAGPSEARRGPRDAGPSERRDGGAASAGRGPDDLRGGWTRDRRRDVEAAVDRRPGSGPLRSPRQPCAAGRPRLRSATATRPAPAPSG